MKEVITSRKVYPLTLPFRLLLIVPGILFTLAPIFISLNLGTVFRHWQVYVFFVVIGGILIYYGLTTFLITSPDGMESYFLFPFHFNLSWKDLEYIYLEDSGIVYLFWNTDDKKWFQKKFGGRLQLSLFVENWENGELISEIQYRAPHLEIPEKILSQPNHAIWQHSNTMMFFYTFCILFLLPPVTFISGIIYFNSIRFALSLALFGFMGGIFGGMVSLVSFNELLKRRRNKKYLPEIGEMTKWNYVLPFSGWIIPFILGIFIQGKFIGWEQPPSRTTGMLSYVVLMIAMILQPLLLPYLSYNRPKK